MRGGAGVHRESSVVAEDNFGELAVAARWASSDLNVNTNANTKLHWVAGRTTRCLFGSQWPRQQGAQQL
jgi:hypothetical protein